MPKSRRDKVVALTQTKKKGRERKGGLIESVREALEDYSSVFVFRCQNQRNNTFKEMKKDLDETSRFFMGSNKVLQVALGKGPEDEQREGIHRLARHIKGHAGLVFTNLTKDDLEVAFEKYRVSDYARTGTTASQTVIIEKGPVHGPHGGLMEHTLEPMLRKNGMPTKLNRGVIELLADHTVCKEKEHISPAGAILLRLFGHELAEFSIDLLCGWVRMRGVSVWGKRGKGEGVVSRSFIISSSQSADSMRTFEGRWSHALHHRTRVKRAGSYPPPPINTTAKSFSNTPSPVFGYLVFFFPFLPRRWTPGTGSG